MPGGAARRHYCIIQFVKKFVKWLAGLVAFLVICIVALVLAKDYIARRFFIAMVEQKTGYAATVDTFKVGLLTPTLHILGLKLNYPADKGGRVLMDSPEIFVEYDRDAAKRNEIHLKQLRWNIREIGVEDSNSSGMEGLVAQASALMAPTNQVAPDPKSPIVQSPAGPAGVNFTGIDTLDFSLGTVHFRNPKNALGNRDMAIDLQNRKLTNVVSYMDLSPLAIELIIKGAFSGGNSPGALPFPRAAKP